MTRLRDGGATGSPKNEPDRKPSEALCFLIRSKGPCVTIGKTSGTRGDPSMPFERLTAAPRRIAVIGGGISGMAAAHLLAQDNAVVLFEAENRLGGHARTVMAGKRGDQPVDTGFIVYNKVNYPNLVALFDKLDVPTSESNMSFGASIRGGRLEYGLGGFDAIFAQRSNLVNPRFLTMLRDIVRFNARALELATDDEVSIGDFLDRIGTGAWFREHYLLPLSGAIWSTPNRGDAGLSRAGADPLLPQPRAAWLLRPAPVVHRQGRLGGIRSPPAGRDGAAGRRPAAWGEGRRGPARLRRGRGAQPQGPNGRCSTRSSSPPIPTTRCACCPTPRRTNAPALSAIRYQPNRGRAACRCLALMPKRRAVWSAGSIPNLRAEARPDRPDLLDELAAADPAGRSAVRHAEQQRVRSARI
jgi:uncharacterized protein